MLKVLIITQNEPFFVPKMLEQILKNQDRGFNIRAVTVLEPYRKNRNFFHWYKERAGIYSFKELLIAGMGFIYCKFYNLLLKKSPFSVDGIIQKYSLKNIISEDINSSDYVKEIKRMHIDVIVSISCPQIFKKEILNSVMFCFNAHGTLLPRHRGVFGSWWTLFSGDKKGGSTIHTMDIKIDRGNIFWQKEFNIDNDTQYSLAYRTKKDMAEGVIEVLKMADAIQLLPVIPGFQQSFHRAPTKEEGREFHKKGLKIIKFSDLKRILSKKF